MGTNWGKLIGGAVALAGMGVIAYGASVAVAAGQSQQAEPVVVVALDYGSHDTYDRAAAVDTAVADRDARVAAEAARVAAEQAAAEAAAAEAARIAAEQQAAADQPADDPAPDEPVEEPSGGIPATWIDLGNGTGMWDFSNCPTQSGSTGADGVVYCN